jgi:tRNA pseudouridine55 synthase
MTRRRAAPGAPEGGLVVDKAPGLTSHDIVALARRALGQPRIGHTGTLDPMASGVLPLLLGRATRLAQFLAADDKAYTAVVRVGQATSTYDAEGETAGPSVDWPTDRAAVESALERFRGAFMQTPPAVSAKRVGGRRAYDLVRANQPVTLQPVQVRVKRLALVGIEGNDLCLEVECSAGFYVRSLAHDLGAALGVGAHLLALRRTRSGACTLARAVTVERLVGESAAVAADSVVPMTELLAHVPLLEVTAEGRERLAHGRELASRHVALGRRPTAGYVRLTGVAGDLLGVAEVRAGALHPVVVLM